MCSSIIILQNFSICYYRRSLLNVNNGMFAFLTLHLLWAFMWKFFDRAVVSPSCTWKTITDNIEYNVNRFITLLDSWKVWMVYRTCLKTVVTTKCLRMIINSKVKNRRLPSLTIPTFSHCFNSQDRCLKIKINVLELKNMVWNLRKILKKGNSFTSKRF